MSNIIKKSHVLAVAAIAFAAVLSICALCAANDSSADACRCLTSEKEVQERFVLMIEGEQCSIEFTQACDGSYTKVYVTYGDFATSFNVPGSVADKIDKFAVFIAFEISKFIEYEKYINTTTTTSALTAEEVPAVPLCPAHPVPLCMLFKLAGCLGYTISDIHESASISEQYVNTTT